MRGWVAGSVLLAMLVACGGDDDAGSPATADPARAAECEELLREVDPDITGSDDEVEAHSCRNDGYDPVWNALSIYVEDEDYEQWRDSGTVPTCDDIVGRDDPLSGGEYNEADAADCYALAAGEDLPEREGEFDTAISDAAAECGVDDNVGDEGESISFDTEGEEDFSGDDISEVACVLSALDTPDRVIQRMDGTRALDGTVEDEWGDYEAFWTYHPSSGMRITIFRP